MNARQTRGLYWRVRIIRRLREAGNQPEDIAPMMNLSRRSILRLEDDAKYWLPVIQKGDLPKRSAGVAEALAGYEPINYY